MEIRTYEQVIAERREFEDELFDALTGSANGIFFFIQSPLPDENNSFWDPVVVCLSDQQINNLEIIEQESNCFICTTEQKKFKQVNCCNNKLCLNCINIWFKRSVFCPFCKHDQRETESETESLTETYSETYSETESLTEIETETYSETEII